MSKITYEEWCQLGAEGKSKRIYDMSYEDIQKARWNDLPHPGKGTLSKKVTIEEYEAQMMRCYDGWLEMYTKSQGKHGLGQEVYDKNMKVLKWELENYDKWPFRGNDKCPFDDND